MNEKKQHKLNNRPACFLREKQGVLYNYDRFMINNSQIPGRMIPREEFQYVPGYKL